MLFEYETQRLLLKIIRPEYGSSVLEFYLRDKALFERYEPDRMPGFYTTDYQKKALYIEFNKAIEGTMFRFYVYEKTDPQTIIGTISFFNILHAPCCSCEAGYKFSSRVHHHGYATEALTALANIVFTELNMHRIVACVEPNNAPSIHLLERVGFVREGLCRDHTCQHGIWIDHLQYSLLPTDLRQ